MKRIAVTKFKADIETVLDDVQKSGTPVEITRSGRAIAEIRPPVVKPVVSGKKRKLGGMKGHMKIVGDIVSPFSAWPSGE